MAGANDAVTVFVDDAVCGRLPRVCVRTGRPSNGWLTVHTEVARTGRLSTPLLLLLLVVGPIGWLVLLALALFGSDHAEHLTVRVPWTVDTQRRLDALRRRRRVAWTVAACSVPVAIVTIVAGTGTGAAMADRVVLATAAIVGVAAAAVAAATGWHIGQDAVAVELDASRRWVTLRNVHPAFVGAVDAAHVERARLADRRR